QAINCFAPESKTIATQFRSRFSLSVKYGPNMLVGSIWVGMSNVSNWYAKPMWPIHFSNMAPRAWHNKFAFHLLQLDFIEQTCFTSYSMLDSSLTPHEQLALAFDPQESLDNLLRVGVPISQEAQICGITGMTHHHIAFADNGT
ncbi:hypothetical protein ACJX0J_022958, partial [Zea mays]